MKSLIIFATAFGNTEKVAQAIGKTLEARGETRVVNIQDVKPELLEGIDLLLVGSPTQSMSPMPAIKNWLKKLPKDSLSGKRVTAFDTRVSSGTPSKFMEKFGFAAQKISSELVKKGGSLAGEPGGFNVEAQKGPLRTGELERAAAWAKELT